MSRDFLHPDIEITKHGTKLPHWQQDEVFQFVTFRLGDSLPKEKIRRWNEQRIAWLNTWPPPWTSDQEAEYHRRFTWKIEQWLDQGAGACWFRSPSYRQILESTLMHCQYERVEHHSWVIMPNHVHLLFKPLSPLPGLIQAWKSISAKRLGKGPIWQPNHRDTMIRDSTHFANAVRYIRKNPAKAKLSPEHYSHWESDRAKAVP